MFRTPLASLQVVLSRRICVRAFALLPHFVSVIVIVMAIASVPLLAGEREEAEAAYASGDYDTTMRLWRELAEQGDAEAQFHLGVMYAFGQGGLNDYGQAVAWYRKAADQGHRKAQRYLGHMYANGFGVPKDWNEAAKWYKLANSRETTESTTAVSSAPNLRANTAACPVPAAVDTSAQAADQDGAKPGDRFSLILTEVFPGKTIWNGYFVLGTADSTHVGAFSIVDLNVAVGACPAADECTYSRPKTTAVFYPRTQSVQGVEGTPPCIAFYTNMKGENLGNFSIAGKEWGAYNVREPRFARNGTVAIQKDVSPAR